MNRSLAAAIAETSAAYPYADHNHDAQTPHAAPAAPQPLTRKYDISYLMPDGQQGDFTVRARALRSVENAFAAFGHNAVVQTQRGHLAIEDVWPGDEVRLPDGRYETLMWRGKITLSANPEEDGEETIKLTRFTTDAFGMNRPENDLVLGPAARVLHRASGIRRLTNDDAAFIPAADFVDGNTVVSLVPSRPTPVYQLGFAIPCSILVGGVEFETLNPGTPFDLGLRGAALKQYLSLFPHKKSFEDFGLPIHPRLRLSDLELLG